MDRAGAGSQSYAPPLPPFARPVKVTSDSLGVGVSHLPPGLQPTFQHVLNLRLVPASYSSIQLPSKRDKMRIPNAKQRRHVKIK